MDPSGLAVVDENGDFVTGKGLKPRKPIPETNKLIEEEVRLKEKEMIEMQKKQKSRLPRNDPGRREAYETMKKWENNTIDSVPEGILDQNDPAIASLRDGAMGKEGCYYRALQAVAEARTGKALTAEQIAQSVADLAAQGGIIGEGMYVKKPEAIIEDAFRRLGYLDVRAEVYIKEYEKKPSGNPFVSVLVSTFRDGVTKSHKSLGLSDGKTEIWDSYNPDSDGKFLYANEVYLYY